MAGGLGRTGSEGQEQEGNAQMAEGQQDDATKAKKKTKVIINNSVNIYERATL